ncbi:DUF3667 domain-containing protein [Undibacterium pigrum]|uniref:Uncharacterized protein DUF3667 n=1 Tax=Undibacterium pigrum TaxID=401470 RepID=A0A318J8T9_9BURK|nr:DUF3667 domain-containing protein [Undibacterium pigrum]PXX43171.1 uncharacterized protein DUF3667 [Undibacterium pigrum]
MRNKKKSKATKQVHSKPSENNTHSPILKPATAQSHSASCKNCGATLTGNYCQSCGQPAHVHRSMTHMFEEVLHGIFHFDHKLWRTLPALILRPGKLTREYIAGKRHSYVSPLALLLFLIVAMFFVFSLTMKDPLTGLKGNYKSRDELVVEIYETKETLNKLTLPQEKPAASLPDENPDSIQKKLSKLEAALAEQNRLLAKEEKEQLEAAAEDKKNSSGYDITQVKWIKKVLDRAEKNQALTFYKMKANAAKLAFLLMPISLPFLWLLFVFKRRYNLFDHAVFSLYSLSFMSILFMCIAILGKLNLTTIAGLLFAFVPPVHMFVQLRDAYELGFFASLWRTAALICIAASSLMIYTMIVAGMSL